MSGLISGKTLGKDHHDEVHTAASHSDQGATGAELETLTDGSDVGALHTHVVYAENAKTGLDIASVTDVTAVTSDVTGVVAGDVLIARIWGRLLNNSGANRIYTFTPDFDSVFDPEFGTTIVVHATDIRPVMLEWTLAVASASDARFGGHALAHSSGVPGTWDPATVDHIVTDTTTSDLTGTVTVSFKIRSAVATATQTWWTDGFVIRKISST